MQFFKDNGFVVVDGLINLASVDTAPAIPAPRLVIGNNQVGWMSLLNVFSGTVKA